MAAAGLALVAAALAVAFAPSGGPNLSLAERAYAATSAADEIVYTVTTLTQSGAGIESADRTEMWQYRDRMHNVMDVEQHGKRYRYEHDQRGEVFRTLHDGKVDTIRVNDPGWRDDEGREGFEQNLQTIVDRFRAGIQSARDVGETVFNGRPAHAYAAGDVTFYVDPDTAVPLGMVQIVQLYEPKMDPVTREPVPDKPIGKLRIVETVERFERLPATAENLARLDAPAIDAAEK